MRYAVCGMRYAVFGIRYPVRIRQLLRVSRVFIDLPKNNIGVDEELECLFRGNLA